jgi:hypothetical protein
MKWNCIRNKRYREFSYRKLVEKHLINLILHTLMHTRIRIYGKSPDSFIVGKFYALIAKKRKRK